MTIKDLQKEHRVLHPVITIPGERTEEINLDKIAEEMKDEDIKTSSVDPEQYKGGRSMNGIKQLYEKGDVLLIRLGDYVTVNRPEMGMCHENGYLIQPENGTEHGKPMHIISQREIENWVEMGAQVVHEFDVSDMIEGAVE